MCMLFVKNKKTIYYINCFCIYCDIINLIKVFREGDFMDLVDLNYEFYKKNLEDLKKNYANMFVVIFEEKVVFSNIDIAKAVNFVKDLKPGTYIIQKCEMDEEKTIQTFHTRVRFNA